MSRKEGYSRKGLFGEIKHYDANGRKVGEDVMMIPTDDEHFIVNVDVHVSRQFLGWVFSLGEDIKIVGPDDVVKQMQKEIERLIKQYTINEQI